MANQIGLDLDKAKNSITKVPENILKQIRERKSERWISPGIKVVK
jgi:RNase P/RNase MRP subunit p30